ncbi:MAG TPA: hypothetical protein VKB53_00350 [Gammaproteobacteria bacterium]|nr:hypothetical protein [Gammaproteobacteria bacterium]
MPRPSKTDQEHGYLGAFWKELRLLEADYAGVTATAISPSQRPGIMVFRITFAPFVGEEKDLIGTQAVQFEFPNSSTQTLAGALWSAAMKLTTLVSEADRARRGRPH